MSGNGTHKRSGVERRLTDELRTEFEYLHRGCQQYGVTGAMWRTAKFLFYIAALAMSAWLVQYQAVEPSIAMAFAALLITGPEGLEAWLINRGKLADQRERDDAEQ